MTEGQEVTATRVLAFQTVLIQEKVKTWFLKEQCLHEYSQALVGIGAPCWLVCLGCERTACSRGHQVGETSLGEGIVQFKPTGQGSKKS